MPTNTPSILSFDSLIESLLPDVVQGLRTAIQQRVSKHLWVCLEEELLRRYPDKVNPIQSSANDYPDIANRSTYLGAKYNQLLLELPKTEAVEIGSYLNKELTTVMHKLYKVY